MSDKLKDLKQQLDEKVFSNHAFKSQKSQIINRIEKRPNNNYNNKLVHGALTIAAILMFSILTISYIKQSEPSPADQKNLPVSEKKPIQKKEEPKVEESGMSKEEIRGIIDKVDEVKTIIYDTYKSMELPQPNFSEDTPVDEIHSYYEKEALMIYDEIQPKLVDIATENFLVIMKDRFTDFWTSYGEISFINSYYLEARMEIVHQGRTSITIKTFELQTEYTEPKNVYITTIKKDGSWLIDSIKEVSVKEEPLNLKKEEIEKYLMFLYENYERDIEYVSEGTIQLLDNDKDYLYVYFHKQFQMFIGYTVNGKLILNEIPEELIPKDYQSE
ncbi:hypothetical protein LCL95_07245 [Bacillus timonensis]|nr:hypothetical protein [Bacillus timonensis]